MAWEYRGARAYYYRKRWQNGRVISEYVGPGLVGRLAAFHDQTDRAQAAHEREEFRAAKAKQRELDRAVDGFGELVRSLTREELQAAGYHQHKGQWRRRRSRGGGVAYE